MTRIQNVDEMRREADRMVGIYTVDEINAMSPRQYKSLENRLRRAARRQGLRLEKSRVRDPRATEWGTYHLVDTQTNTLAAYGYQSGYGLGLDDVARVLFEDES
jgi:hypothetical protein